MPNLAPLHYTRPSLRSGCDGGDRPVYSMQWAAAGGVPIEKDYPYILPAATGICNPKVTKMKRAYTGGAVEVDLASPESLFKVCAAVWQRTRINGSPLRVGPALVRF